MSAIQTHSYTVRQWLIYFRAHTGMLEAPIAALGAAAALGSIWRVEVGLWAIAGLAYHFAGYGQNSYYDYVNGYDKNDPNKEHHPLNTGAISVDYAKYVMYGSLAFTILYMVALSFRSTTSLYLIAAAVVCGVIYNVLGKQIKHKYIFISAAHSLLFLIAYTAYSPLNSFVIMVFLALVVHHIFQIAISGDIKDIRQDEASLLQEMGIDLVEYSRYNKDLGDYIRHTQPMFVLIPILLTLLQILLVASAYSLQTSGEGLIHLYTPIAYLYIVASIILIIISHAVVKQGIYKRRERMKNIASREIVGFWLIFISLIPVISLTGYIVGFILSIFYLIIMSQFMWGTFLRPKV